ncbi:MAG: sugar ABC transporter substrate-binding protein [Bacillota bacterium]|nr:sugar ABC transporter substrate-binding protein [Bacillota bacterium]
MKNLKKALALLLASGFSLTLFACNKPAGGTTEAAKADTTTAAGSASTAAASEPANAKKTVGLLTYSLGEEFGVDVLSGVKTAADKLGWEIIAPDPAGDLQKQISQVEDFIQQGVDAIIIAPVDAGAIAPYIEQAKKAGVIVINYDIEAGTDVADALVLCDNVYGGKMAAQLMAEAIGEKGKVLVLTDNPGVVCIDERCSGFINCMKEKYPKIELVQQLSNGTRDTHQKTTENMLTAHSDLAGIFAPDGDHTLGAYTACVQMDRKKIKIVGYDASPEQITIMKDDGNDGILFASIAQYPIVIGRICVETLEKVFKGEDTSETVYVDIGVARADDIQSFKFLS